MSTTAAPASSGAPARRGAAADSAPTPLGGAATAVAEVPPRADRVAAHRAEAASWAALAAVGGSLLAALGGFVLTRYVPLAPALSASLAAGGGVAVTIGLATAWRRWREPAPQQLPQVPAPVDALAAVTPRERFVELAQREWERARRYAVPCAMLVIDADHLSAINAAHGRAGGDSLLRSIAEIAGGALRQSDLLGRLDAPRIAVFLPHTDLLGAVDVAERIRQRVLLAPPPGGDKGAPATVSIGVAPMRSELPTLDWMTQEAETALQCAKVEGRNCVRALQFVPSKEGGTFRVNPR